VYDTYEIVVLFLYGVCVLPFSLSRHSKKNFYLLNQEDRRGEKVLLPTRKDTSEEQGTITLLNPLCFPLDKGDCLKVKEVTETSGQRGGSGKLKRDIGRFTRAVV